MPAKKKKAKRPQRKTTKRKPAPRKKDGEMFSVKRHISHGHILIAACDADLLGRKLEDGELCIEVHESFYGGEKVKGDILMRLLEMCTMANLVGKNAVKLALGMSLVDEDCVITIEGVPHAQVLKFC